MELFVRPEILVGVARLKEDSLRALPFVLLKFGGVNEQGAARALDDARRPDQLLERHLVDRGAAGEEVEWRVNVRARVRAEMEVGEVDDVASLDRPEPDELGRRVARVDGCLARDNGHGNVNPVARAARPLGPGRGRRKSEREGGCRGDNYEALKAHDSSSGLAARGRFRRSPSEWSIIEQSRNLVARGGTQRVRP